MKHDQLIESTIKYFSKLPGFGPRSAKKTVLFFLKNKDFIQNFITNLTELEQKIKLCEVCFNASTTNKCNICLDENRDKSKICVVSDIDDIWNIEKSLTFKGVYHSLCGNLSAVSGVTPDKLTIQSFLSRLSAGEFSEVIFANNLSIDGATTVFYIIDEIEKLQTQGIIKQDLMITELANGIPIGANLEYMDEGTIEVAFKGRREIK